MSDGAVLVISNLEEGDDIFDCDVGSWNVSRAKRDCNDGKHKAYFFDVPAAYEHNKNIEVDPAKVAKMVLAPEWLYQQTLIFCTEKDRIYLIDGHHRLRAMHRLGWDHCVGYVIEERDAAPYQVRYNGERVAPWMKEG